MKKILNQILSNLIHLGSIQITNIVLQLLLIPLVTSRVGIEANGLVLTAFSLSGLLSILINFAGNQTIPVLLDGLNTGDDVLRKNTAKEISANLMIRLFIFGVLTLVITVIYFSGSNFGVYLFCIVPILLSEVLNPQAFLLSLGKIKYFNYANFLSRSLVLLLAWNTLHRVEQAPQVNAWGGLLLSFFYFGLWVVLIRRKIIILGKVQMRFFFQLVPVQANLVGGNMIVHLQQSVFLYGLGLFASPSVLGVYSILDKLVSGIRTALISFSIAIYPFAIKTYNQSQYEWHDMRKKVNRFFLLFFSVIGFLILCTASMLAGWLIDGQEQSLLTIYIRWMSLVPLLIALNALNVQELLIKKEFFRQFTLSMQLLVLSVALSLFFLAPFYSIVLLNIQSVIIPYLACYLIFMESITLLLYERNHHRHR